MAALPATLPELPANDNNVPWPHEVMTAQGIVSRAFQAAHQLVRHEAGDALRLRQHLERISTLVPLLQGLEKIGPLQSWAISCAHVISRLKLSLEHAAIGAEE